MQQSKKDRSWQRYQAGWPEVRDRYDMTANLVRGPSVLDIGCGQALLGYLLSHRPDIGRYVGLDSWGEMLDEAKERGNFELQLGKAEELPFGDGEFDCVVLGQVLEHAYDERAAVQEALRTLRVGGRLIVNVPADDRGPHGNHVRAFRSIGDVLALFGDAVRWEDKGRVHECWFAWGDKC